MKRLPIFFLALVALASNLHAATVIQTFNDIADAALAVGMPLRDLDVPGGIGFTTGFEQGNTGVPVTRTNDLTVPLANYVSGQDGTARHWSVASVTGAAAPRRTQTRSTPSMSGTIWFSFLASLQTTNGDVALTFNGGWGTGSAGNGQPTSTGGGMRVGLGSVSTASVRGALGVGPLASSSGGNDSWGLSLITDGVNGAVTAANFAPTDGTPGLVLGRIDTDPGTGYPRVSLWYNPDVPDEASLPAPTLTFVDTTSAIVPTTVTRIGYQVVRGAAQNEVIDNVKVSDEPTAFDIVYKNAPLPIPVVSVTATVAVGSETGPTNLTFTVSSDKLVTAPLTVAYRLTGVATNGYDGSGGFVDADYTDPNFNAGTLTSSVTIPAGQPSAVVTLTVADDALAEGNESVVFTIQNSTDYIGGGSAATGSIIENNDANVSLQYMFTRTLAPQVWDENLTALPAVVAGIGAGSYSGAYFVSPDAAYSAGGDWTAADANGAITNGDYMGLAISPVAGRTLTLTNLQFQAVYGNYLYQVPEAAAAVVFVRSSLDNFSANLAEFTLLPDGVVFPNIWYSNFVALGSEFSNLPGQVEFRLYIYDDSNHNQVGVRIDNLYFNGGTAELPAGVNQVSVSTNVVHAAEPATAGQFTINRVGDTSSPLTVNYSVAGTAVSGTDYQPLTGTATFAAGENTALVNVIPIDDETPEATKTVTLALTSGAGYGVLQPSSAALNLLDDGDVGGLLAWFFNENNNAGGSLAAVAGPSIKLTDRVAALNAVAGPGLGVFGAFTGSGALHGYGSSVSRSAPSTLYIGNGALGTTAAAAVANGDYVSFAFAPKPGYAVTLTNLSAWLMLRPDAGQTNWVFLRSSLDNFTSDLGSFTIHGTTNNSPETFRQWSTPLAIADYPGALEFRVYVYSSSGGGSFVFRLEDVTFQGSASAAPLGSEVVTVAASDASAAEPGADTGAFTLTRWGGPGGLTVNYTIGGTASNGVDYTLLNGTANFAAGENTVSIPVLPSDDDRPELTETVTLTILPNANYYIGLASSATVNLADDGDTKPLFTFATADNNAYERVADLSGAFALNRALGEMASTITINFTLGGTAVLGVDYVSSVTNSVTFEPGVTGQTILIVPMDNALEDGDRTVTLTVQTAPDFILDLLTTNTVTIVDDEAAAEPELWSDNFDAGTSAANYTVQAGSDLGVDDYAVDFAFDYSSIGLPPAPGGTTTLGLMLNANALGAPGGVNFYPNGQSFSGNFALRFNLYVSMDPLAGADNEAVYFGINQTGLATNWLASMGTAGNYTNYGEGIWATVATRDGTPGIATLRAAASAGATPVLVGSTGNFPDLFNSPPHGQLGRPNNTYDSINKTWVDCELSQLGGVISLMLNNSVVLQYTNTTAFTSGNVFIGYGDPFATLGSANCYAVIDNIRVVRLAAPAVQPGITAISVSGGAVEITFGAGPSDTVQSFKLQASSVVSGGYEDDTTATLTTSGPGVFKFTTTASGPAQFYRVRRE